MQDEPQGPGLSDIDPVARTSRKAHTTIHFIGGESLKVVQGPSVANTRLEAAHEASNAFTALSEPHGKVAFISPGAVAYVVDEREMSEEWPNPREAHARVHLADGRPLDIVQGVGVAHKRLEDARASHGLFAYLMDSRGRALYVSRLAVTHLTGILS